jgi:hypothetical protein
VRDNEPGRGGISTRKEEKTGEKGKGKKKKEKKGGKEGGIHNQSAHSRMNQLRRRIRMSIWKMGGELEWNGKGRGGSGRERGRVKAVSQSKQVVQVSTQKWIWNYCFLAKGNREIRTRLQE